MGQSKVRKEVWLVYDGECPICRPTANAIKIKNAVGTLHLVNARETHPILEQIKKAGVNLDDGMVVKFQDTLYHGVEAQHILALIGTNSDWFNRLNVCLFRSKFIAKFIYPILKLIRSILLKFNSISKLNNLAPANSTSIFASVFGQQWETLPEVIRKRYANRSYSDDLVTVEGKLDIYFSSIMYLFLPIFRLLNILAPYQGKDVSVIVNFRSELNSSALYFDRTFYFTGKPPYKFCSYMQHIKDDIVVEFIRFGVGWRMKLNCKDGKIVMQHNGYVWGVFGKLIPIPIGFLLGEIYAEEQMVSDNSFHMLMTITHPLFGKTFEYSGEFRLVENK